MSWITKMGGSKRMKDRLLVVLMVGLMLTICVGTATARRSEATDLNSAVPAPTRLARTEESQEARADTLWLFYADFEDLSGDNAGWLSLDISGTAGQENKWHQDTIHPNPGNHGVTWWCGTVTPCWVYGQDRGYGNNWIAYLIRDFPLASWSAASDTVSLNFDQRFAMEHDYDYGYLDISTDGGSTWDTPISYTNPGFAGKPGFAKDWDSDYGEQAIDISSYAGQDITVRYRFESDGQLSSQDCGQQGGCASVEDGAWQIDNVEITVASGSGPVQKFFDDMEGGENDWETPYIDPKGQTGIKFTRGQYGEEYDFETGQDFTCEDRPQGSWMYAAVSPATGVMGDDQYTWLLSPPIDISGATKLVGRWDMWVDLMDEANDLFDLKLASSNFKECVQLLDGLRDEDQGYWYGGPFWGTWLDDWDAFAGNNWLSVAWELLNYQEMDEGGEHRAGIFLNKQWVGVPAGSPETSFSYGGWNGFNDWFEEQLADALVDTAFIEIKDDDTVASAQVIASTDGGTTWHYYPMYKQQTAGPTWFCPPLADLYTAGNRIFYYFEATDKKGNIATYPGDAPDRGFEFSFLPIKGQLGLNGGEGIILVDKHGRATPGESRYGEIYHTSEYYYTEMLGILGYEYDKYDVEVPSGSRLSDGPDSSGMKYYDTQIWFTNEFNTHTLNPRDQRALKLWLDQADAPTNYSRNLLLTGNDIGKEMIGSAKDTLNFYAGSLKSDWIQNSVGAVTVDSLPLVHDVEPASGDTFMTKGECILRGGCPVLNYFDVIDPAPGTVGSGGQVALVYEKQDESTLNAGVAYTDPLLNDYQIVNLGFGIEFMMDSLLPSGYYLTGVEYRVDLMDRIMKYFEKSTTGGTDVPSGTFKNALTHAYPNPFNPQTTIAYSVKDAGPASITIYNVAGKVVKTYQLGDLPEGTNGQVTWYGRNDSGEKCASGVYFYRIDAKDFSSTKKMVMLK